MTEIDLKTPETQHPSTEGCRAYLAPEGFIGDLVRELGDFAVATYNDLVLAKNPQKPVHWVANEWFSPQFISINSIGDAAKKLRTLQRSWALYPFANHRRAKLITDNLPKVSAKPLAFGTEPPNSPLGSWSLINANTMLVSPRCSSLFPNGELQFVEDRSGSPSRAYLKLWEVFTILGVHPKAGEFCIDMGACPGGWTWVLQQLGAKVLSVDKVRLDEKILALPNVTFRSESSFALDPSEIGPVDWFFSDVICYPKRLLTMVRKWMDAGTVRHFICTIKFQAETDFETIEQFAAIAGSQIIHLHNNKHELTWIKL